MSSGSTNLPVEGGGVASINGDTTAAQVIVGGTNISVVTAGGTTTITDTGGGGTVTSVSTTPTQGVTSVVTNPTTTPSISIGLGNITPTSVAATGAVTGSNLSGTNTGDQTIAAGTNISVSVVGATTTVNNSAPTQSVVAGTGISVNTVGTTTTVTNTSPSSGGTVTSINVSGGTTGLTTSGGPVTTSGTITLAGTLAIANGGTNSSTALNNKRVMESIGGAIVEAAAITANRALQSDANGLPVASATTAAELGFLSGVTSSIQTQLNTKGSGTVTSVAMTVPSILSVAGSPITTSGSLDLSLTTEPANTVFSGPTSGGAATPTFRSLVVADIPALTSANISNFTTATQTVASNNATKRVLYVSQDTGNDANDGSLLAPFKTIQAGINAANTTAAYLAQVVVMIAPSVGGTGYNENITLSQQGVHLQAMAPLLRSDASLITGTITVNLTGTSGGANFLAGNNDVYINGLITTSGASDGITFSGTVFQRLWISNCFIQSLSGGTPLVVSNSGVSGGGVKSTVTSYDVTYLNNSAVTPTVSLTAGRCWNYGVNAAIQNNNVSGHSIDQSGTTSFICDTVGIMGQVNVTSNVATATITNSTIASGSLAAIATPASPNTGTIVIANVGITTTATNSMTGAGVLVFAGANVKLSTGGDAISTITQAVFPKFPEGQTLLGAKATAVTNSLLIIKDGHLTSQQTTAPTIVASSNAGTGATASLAKATDVAGEITIVTGTVGLSTGSYATVTFNKTYNVAPIVMLTPAGSTLSTSVYVTSTTTGFSINFAVAGGISSTYILNYHVIGTQ